MKVHIVYKHPLVIRWMHWINFPLLTIMIWSGALIYWANDVYEIRIGSLVLFHFFPQWLYNLFHIPYKLSEGMAYHFVFMWLFLLNGLLYVIYTVMSGEWKYLIPQKNSLKESWQVIRHDLGLVKTLPPQSKYNGAQRIAYSMIILMGMGSILTGLAIYKPVQMQWLTTLLGGYETARAEHFFLTIGYVMFFFVHLFQVIRAGWNNFRAMVTGYEIESSKDK